jgi:hypothetical protein
MENRSQEWIDQTTGKIRDIFEVFDKDKIDSVAQVEYLHLVTILVSAEDI